MLSVMNVLFIDYSNYRFSIDIDINVGKTYCKRYFRVLSRIGRYGPSGTYLLLSIFVPFPFPMWTWCKLNCNRLGCPLHNECLQLRVQLGIEVLLRIDFPNPIQNQN